jgi:spermidine/putrescine transport system substrate-binding protein
MKKILSLLPFRFLYALTFVGIIAAFLFLPLACERKIGGTSDLNLLVWPQLFSEQAIDAFEKKYNVRVNMTYFDSNDELMAKLSLAGGSEYDVVSPTDFSLAQFVDRGLLEPISIQKVPAVERLHQRLVEVDRINGSLYAVPYCVTLYGIGINTDYVPSLAQPSWEILFNGNYRVCMTDDPIEVISVVQQYLGYQHDKKPKRDDVLRLLRKQRSFIEAYSDVRVDYFLVSGACAAAMAPSFAVSMSYAAGAPVEFYMPQEGGFLIVDSLAVSASSRKKELAMAFINFMMKQEYLYNALHRYGMLAPDMAVLKQQDLRYFKTNKSLEEIYQATPLIHHPYDRATMNQLWLDLKA